MSFIWPVSFLLLLVIPLLVVLYLRLYRQRQAVVARFGNLRQTQGVAKPHSDRRRHIPPILFLVALAIFIIALARPVTLVSLPRIEGTVILAFDVSGSMAADDLKPTRMEAAKVAAQDFVQHQPSTVEIGVVAFSDNGLNVQVPTRDQGAVLAAIKRLTPQTGSSIGSGIQASLSLIAAANGQPAHLLYSNLTPTPAPSPTPVPAGIYNSAVIVLLTDGENNESPDPLAVAQAASDQGVRIYTVGIGSAAGANLHINGFTVHTQLDEATLQQIAQIAHGTYFNAQSEEALDTIYSNLTPQLIAKPEQTEITAIVAGIGIIVLLIGSALSLFWFRRLP